MVARVSAAICGAAIILACSPAEMTRSAPTGDPTWLRLARRGVVAIDPAIIGVASMYNPYRPGSEEGGTATASGEPYNPTAWAAAIQIDLREKFGGVRYGMGYRPAYALVESADKRVIVKINDVGPLKPGRVIDLNEQTMRYFDPTLRRGLVHDVKVTPLPGDDWPPGPVERGG